MIPRGLLYTEWKKNQWLFLCSGILLMAANPFMVYNNYSTYQECLNNPALQDCEFVVNYTNGSPLSFSWSVSVIIAVFLLGLERTKGTMDALLSMPYSRGQIFQTKFWLGAAVIVVPQAIGYGAASLLISLLKPSHTYDFDHFSIGMIVISFMAYALLMASGALTGQIFAQLLTAFTVTVLPFLLIGLPAANLEVVFDISVGSQFSFISSYIESRLFIFVTPIGYVFNDWIRERDLVLIIPIVMSLVFYLIGYVSFLKHPNERNGRFFLWRKLDRPVQILVIAFAVMGFGVFGYGVTDTMFGYLAGIIFGAVIGFFISYFTVYRKSKHM
ncbi:MULTISPECIES: ABC transporter permease [Bacillus amyloliquefaciens group]|uniref:ABC transporter permease n=1 Tax=Bacillus amyloliquefaciens group TaxID=1938374 RepID=UPI000BEB11F9|nr:MULTISPECIES: ABC transporter permease [Bacillus amyloliquefaciens group]ATL40621.1 ABC transporter permease [Bacillus velezensis]MEA1007216.1 ABC transporter permease [Bacillus velezensis]QOH67351.1 ABC transporter permease [Bacillus amyloliquefaciens]USQ52825.1 ABC transporter permease [Bacillus velezensis]UUY37504.1 ABC transporter permease [Bacillus velezensis]